MKEKKQTRAVHCPVCGRGRVIDAAAGVDPGRLRLYSPEHADRAEVFYKCRKGGGEVGITYEKAEDP